MRFERQDDIDPALTLQVGEPSPIKQAALFEPHITCASHRGLLQHGTTQRDIVPLHRRAGDRASASRTLAQRPQRGPLIATRIRPSLVFDHPAPLRRPGFSGHRYGRRIKEVHPSTSSHTRLWPHRAPDKLVVPAHPWRGHLQGAGFGIRLLHRLLASPARRALADFHRHPERWRW